MIKNSTVRFTTASDNIPLFTEAGLNIARGTWFGVDLDRATPEARDVIELHLGRLIQVHPEDADQFYAITQLEPFEGRFRYPEGTSGDAPPIGQRHRIDEGEIQWPPVDVRDPSPTIPRDARGRRLDGPTLEEFMTKGYPASAYPPSWYAPRNSPAFRHLEEQQAAARLEFERVRAEAWAADNARRTADADADADAKAKAKADAEAKAKAKADADAKAAADAAASTAASATADTAIAGDAATTVDAPKGFAAKKGSSK